MKYKTTYYLGDANVLFLWATGTPGQAKQSIQPFGRRYIQLKYPIDREAYCVISSTTSPLCKWHFSFNFNIRVTTFIIISSLDISSVGIDFSLYRWVALCPSLV